MKDQIDISGIVFNGHPIIFFETPTIKTSKEDSIAIYTRKEILPDRSFQRKAPQWLVKIIYLKIDFLLINSLVVHPLP